MQKSEAIALLGGSVAEAAKAIQIKSSAVSQWPDVLPPRLQDRVIAACVRRSIPIPDALRKAVPTKEEVSHG